MQSTKNYKFVFWGNINIHIYPLVEALAKVTEVTIIYDRRLFTNRKERQISYQASSTLHLIDLADIISYKLSEIIDNCTDDYTIHINGSLKAEKTFTHKALNILTTGGGVKLFLCHKKVFSLMALKHS